MPRERDPDAVFAIAMGGIGGGAVASVAAWFANGLARGLDFGLHGQQAIIASVGGVFVGFVSLAYLIPLLEPTRVGKSLPLVLSVGIGAALGGGLAHPLVGVLLMVAAQMGSSAYAHGRYRPAWTRGVWACKACDYAFGELVPSVCPECGTKVEHLPRASRLVCAACSQAWTDQRSARCAYCGAIDLDRVGRVVEVTPPSAPPPPAHPHPLLGSLHHPSR